MEKSKINLNLILRIAIPIIIFIILMVVGTIYDLAISKALVSGLDGGKYYTSNFMAKLVEIVGPFPIWGAAFFASLVLFRYFKDKEGKLAKVMMVLFILGQVGFATMFIRDCFKYGFRYAGCEDKLKEIYMLAIFAIFGLVSGFLGTFFYRKVSAEFNNKVVKMALVIICSCAFYLVVELIKGPVGRIRYRAMNELGNFDLYQPWYHVGKDYVQGIDVIKDGLKSFPSGHSFSAGIIFVITCLPYCFERLNNTKCKIIFTAGALIYTAFVMLFRIVAGAHFLTDTLVGAALAIIPIMVFRYVFLIRKKKVA